MFENDKTIFTYLKPSDNDMISSLNKRDIEDLLLYLNKYYLEYRDTIGVDSFDTFGIEIEVEHFNKWGKVDFFTVNQEVNDIVGNKKWDVRNDISLVKGAEFVSEILTDNVLDWQKVRRVCDFSSLIGKVDVDCAAHIHVGSQVLGENTLHWYHFFKLWSIYENVIYRFCYGEYLNCRPGIMTYARPAASFYDSKLEELESKLNDRVIDMIKVVEPISILDRFMKKYGVSYWRMLHDNDYQEYEDFNKIINGCSFELRVPNGTVDEVIWQNNINFFLKMIKYCKSNSFNDDILDKRRVLVRNIYSSLSAYSLIYLDQAIELCDLIFDNNLDKLCFLRQYLKSLQVTDNAFVKARKFTCTSIKR